MKKVSTLVLLVLVAVTLLAGCGGRGARSAAPVAQFTLQSGFADGRLAYVGVGGAIDGQINPNLPVRPGERVRLTVIMGDGTADDLSVADVGKRTPILAGKGREAEIEFTAPAQPGAYPYFCTVAGHRQAGMEGMLVVRAEGA